MKNFGFITMTIGVGFAVAMTACELPKGAKGAVLFPRDPRADKAVCDPFGPGSGGLSSDHGWIGALSYLEPKDQQGNVQLNRFSTRGIQVNAPVYLRELNIPTQYFSRGFQTGDGTQLKDADGNTLFEYFSLDLESEIRLSDTDQPGYYQFAILSDDGSVVEVDATGKGPDTLINNDGMHMTKMACAQKPVYLDHSSRLPIRVGYYQGPRYHIALVLLWKRLPDPGSKGPYHDRDDSDDSNSSDDSDGSFLGWGNGYGNGGSALRDPACGLEGNSMFFDSTQVPSAPRPAWLGLVQRGWTVVPAQNAYLPVREGTNPCGDPNPQPSPSASPSVGPSASPTPDPTASQTPTATATPDPTASPTPTATATPDPTASPTPTVTATPDPTASPTPTATATPDPTASPTPTASPSPSPTYTPPSCSGPGCGGGLIGV